MLEQQPKPSEFLKKSQNPDNLSVLEGLASPLFEGARDLAELLQRHPWITGAIIRIVGDSDLEGEVVLQKDSGDTHGINISIEGQLGRGIENKPKGEPFHGQFDATVFFQASPNKPPYAETGEIVQKEQPLLWVFISKNTQFAVTAPVTGRITYVVENGQQVKGNHAVVEEGNEVAIPGDILFYIEPQDKL
jgi:hypothetical protein